MKHILFYLKAIALLMLCVACMSGQTGDSSADLETASSETTSGTTDLSDPGTQTFREQGDSPAETKSRKIGNKTILGYLCDGYEITSSGGLVEIWITNEAPVGVIGDLSTLNLPTSLADFTPDWGQNAFFLEMTHRDPATNSTVVLKCTDLSKKSLEIDINDYEIVENIFQ